VIASRDVFSPDDGSHQEIFSYDGEGVLESAASQNLDDGRDKTTTYEDGVRSAAVTTDGWDYFSWSSITDENDAREYTSRTSAYEHGELKTLEVVLDNGRIETTEYRYGTAISETIQDGANEFEWASVQTRFDGSGDQTSIYTVYDDGREELQSFDSSGLLVSVSATDAADAYDWASITEAYDGNGALTARVTVFDDDSQVSSCSPTRRWSNCRCKSAAPQDRRPDTGRLFSDRPAAPACPLGMKGAVIGIRRSCGRQPPRRRP